MLGLANPRDKEVWQYILGLAAELEFLAVCALWLRDGKPGSVETYQERVTLYQAARRAEASSLLDTTTIETLKAVADLRNSVAHRDAVYGVATPGGRRGVYKGGHVFTDLGTLKRLGDDVEAAAQAILRRQDEFDPPGYGVPEV